MYSRNNKESSVGADLVKGKVIGDEVGIGNRSCRTLWVIVRNLDFI